MQTKVSYLSDLRFNLETWKRELRFHFNEMDTFQEKLEEIAAREFDKRARRSIAGGRDKPPQRAGVSAVSERERGTKKSLTMSSTVSVISRHQQALQQQALQQRRRATAATSMGAGESSWSGAWTNCRACARHLCGSCRLVLIQAVVVLCSVLFLLGCLVTYVRAVQRLRGLETRL